MRRWVKFLLVIGSVLAAGAAETSDTKPKSCQSQKKCGDCFTAASDCAWCLDKDFEKPRCGILEDLKKDQCQGIENPTHKIIPVKNKTLSDGNKDEEAVQISPQHIKVELRPNKPARVQFSFYMAKNYPVDMYFLMDFSYTMKDYIAQLSDMINGLVQEMQKTTGRLRVGFGSFIDKVVLPYTSVLQKNIENPCQSQGIDCVSPYSYKNQLSLTTDIKHFKGQVISAIDKTSANIDAPEGGFDAMLQALVCEKEINWSNSARKLLIYASDAPFHFAGDGKLGGIVVPNDGHCHLDGDSKYTEGKNQDYPSVGQIAEIIRAKKVNVIFAVAGSMQMDLYNKLMDNLEGAAVGHLALNSSTLRTIVQNNYKNITSKVEMKAENTGMIRVSLLSNCMGNSKKTNICEGVKIGANLTFEAVIEALECPSDLSKRKQNITIYPVGLNDKLVLEVELKCQCGCEEEENVEPNSPHCSDGSGTYTCGICECNSGRKGNNCQCNSTDVSTDDTGCRLNNISAVCSSRGICDCGKCICNRKSLNSNHLFTGKYCQCDDYFCPYVNGKLCGGPSRGKCRCGACECVDGYTGGACDCPTRTDTCMTESGKICNNFGVCECGKCKCDSRNDYRGPKCEDCPTCTVKCKTNKECAHCKAFQGGSKTKEECEQQCSHIILVDELEVGDDVKECISEIEDNCRMHFSYKYDQNGTTIVQVLKKKSCPEKLNLVALILGIIGGILAIGIVILIIWKILTTWYDNKEYARFEAEKRKAKWETQTNPIYRNPVTHFENPSWKKS